MSDPSDRRFGSRSTLDEHGPRPTPSLHPTRSPGLLLWRATLAWQRRVTAALKPHGLTHAQFVLLASTWWLECEHGAAPTQRMISEHAGVEPMMTSQVLRTLESKGLLERQCDKHDARARRVTVTHAGQALTSASLPDVEAVDDDFFAPVATGVVETLVALTPEFPAS